MSAPSGDRGRGTDLDRNSGETAADAGATIAFPQGLPGFPSALRFALRAAAPGIEGLLLLQSTDDPDLRFLVMPYHEADVPLRRGDLDAACAALGVPAEHAAVLLVVTRRTEPDQAAPAPQLFVNLRAPLVLDTQRGIGVQHVLPVPDYPVRHPLARAA